MKTKYTKGEWILPHLADEKATCNCGFVLSEKYCGAIATVHFSVDRNLENGDNPPLEEAIANAKLIAAAPDLLESLIKINDCLNDGISIIKDDPFHKTIKKAILKATE